MSRIRPVVVGGIVLVAGLAASQAHIPVARNLSVGPLTVGAISIPLSSAAFAQGAESLVLDNVVFTSGGSTYEAKRIEFQGLSSSRAEIDAILSGASSEPLETRLARLNARQVRVPDLRVTQKLGPQTQIATYKNILLKDLVGGRIGETSADAAGAELSGGKGRTSFSYGHTSVTALDLPALARLYETKAEPGSAPLVKIYGSFSIADLNLLNEDDGSLVKIGRVAGRDFVARPISDSWSGASALFAEFAAKDKLSTDEQSRLIGTLAEVLEGFDFGFVEATDVEMTATKDNPQTITRVARISHSSADASRVPGFRVEGMETRGKDGRFAVAAIDLAGFSLKPTLDSLRKLRGRSLDDLDATTARSLMPTLGTLKVTGVDIDSAAGDGSDQARVKSTIGELLFAGGYPVNGIPSSLKIEMRNFAVALPSKSDADGLKDLIALGYKNVDVSFLLAAGWSEQTNNLLIRDLSLRGVDMADLSITGTIGNVSKDLFDPDQAVASVALMASRIKALDIMVENKGLYERFLSKTAKEEKTTPNALRQAYGMGASVVVPSVLGHSTQATQISQAIARFIAKPGRLSITAKVKDPEGISVVELFTLSDPKALMERIDVSAAAE